ncbi:TetR/AcrR family transcriptional regulator [Catelliglobosispora koreensis]|uniref:TetR/AcrR family transcriptional regulator n=1 Tax=Catelliglobosispora koreensis TaxID=129052 RepID=UPI00035F0D09|nr:TetR/AcrR family transcriptional regulator [Catelliglobosispora koreensis]
MAKRAEHVEHTRQRIIEAAVHLHGTVGPAATTIAGIAEQAGVTRLTVYRHFADETALFAACSAHWLSQQRPPDAQAWQEIAGPEQRLRFGLADLYRFYRDGEPMLRRIYGDIEALPAPHRDGLRSRDVRLRDVLLAPFGQPRNRRLKALAGHAVAFSTWRSLCADNGLSHRDAVEAMVRLILAEADR